MVDQDKNKTKKEDMKFIAAMLFLTVLFSVRKGEVSDMILDTLRGVFVCIFYGVGTVFLIIGITKKAFKYHPTRMQIMKWAAALAAFFAVSQFVHEGFLMLTGQMPK